MRTKQFIFTVILCCISIFSIKGEIKKEYHIEKDGFEWYEIRDSDKWPWKYGAADKRGKQIIPTQYSSLYYYAANNDNGHFVVQYNDESPIHGIFDRNGNCIISPTRTYIFTPSIRCAGSSTIPGTWTTNDGFSYIEVNSSFGWDNELLKECCTCSYDKTLLYMTVLLADITGKTILDPKRKYRYLFPYYEKGHFFFIGALMQDDDLSKSKFGVIDANENIVIPFKYSNEIKYRNGNFVTMSNGKEIVIGNVNAVKTTKNLFVGGTLNHPESTPAQTTQTTSTSENSNSSDDDGLLYKGMYSCDGQGYDTYSGQSFFSDMVAGNYEMTISENDLHWNFYTAFYKYTTKNGTRVYESNGLTEDVFYVSPSYNVYFTSTMSSWMGTNTWRYNLTKGQSTYSPQPYNGGGSYNNNNPSNSYNSSTSSPSSTPQKRWRNVTRTETCPSCHGSGKCNTCNGKGYFNNPYGTGTVSCSNCNHGRCRKCGGSGTITKTEQVYE